MRKTTFRAMMKQRKFGRKFLPKKALTLKSSTWIALKMATSWVCRAAGFSSTTIKKTGGAAAAVLIARRLAIHAGRTVRCFMILVSSITMSALGKRIQPVIAADLWKSVTKCLCSIAGWMTVALSR